MRTHLCLSNVPETIYTLLIKIHLKFIMSIKTSAIESLKGRSKYFVYVVPFGPMILA